MMVREEGPDIFSHRNSAIMPSESVEPLPSSFILSTGKTITVSLPALAMGGLFVSRHPSHENSLLQELISKAAAIRQNIRHMDKHLPRIGRWIVIKTL
jgi:hypothetical protein